MRDHEEHRAKSPKRISIGIITISSSRYRKKNAGKRVSDPSGSLAQSTIEGHGYKIHSIRMVDDDIAMIRRGLLGLVREKAVDGVILIGGTGVSKRDVTIEAVSPLLEKNLEGFGEIFRAESYKKVGTSAYLSRAIAGVISGKMIYCLPGSKDAVKVAMSLILPEISHALYIARS